MKNVKLNFAILIFLFGVMLAGCSHKNSEPKGYKVFSNGKNYAISTPDANPGNVGYQYDSVLVLKNNKWQPPDTSKIYDSITNFKIRVGKWGILRDRMFVLSTIWDEISIDQKMWKTKKEDSAHLFNQDGEEIFPPVSYNNKKSMGHGLLRVYDSALEITGYIDSISNKIIVPLKNWEYLGDPVEDAIVFSSEEEDGYYTLQGEKHVLDGVKISSNFYYGKIIAHDRKTWLVGMITMDGTRCVPFIWNGASIDTALGTAKFYDKKGLGLTSNVKPRRY